MSPYVGWLLVLRDGWGARAQCECTVGRVLCSGNIKPSSHLTVGDGPETLSSPLEGPLHLRAPVHADSFCTHTTSPLHLVAGDGSVSAPERCLFLFVPPEPPTSDPNTLEPIVITSSLQRRTLR